MTEYWFKPEPKPKRYGYGATPTSWPPSFMRDKRTARRVVLPDFQRLVSNVSWSEKAAPEPIHLDGGRFGPTQRLESKARRRRWHVDAVGGFH